MEKEKVIERVKQIKARLLGYPMDAIADIHFILEFLTNLMEEMEKEVEENKRLKEQLKDYENTLKDYADGYNYAYVDNGFAFYSNNYFNEGLAQETLEKWEVK